MIPYWTTKLEMHQRCITFSPPKHILTKSLLSDICQFSLQSILSNQQTAYEWAVNCHNRTVFIPSSGDRCYTYPWAGIVVVSSGCENCTLTTNHNLLWYLKATTYEILNQYFFLFLVMINHWSKNSPNNTRSKIQTAERKPGKGNRNCSINSKTVWHKIHTLIKDVHLINKTQMSRVAPSHGKQRYRPKASQLEVQVSKLLQPSMAGSLGEQNWPWSLGRRDHVLSRTCQS